MPQMTGMDIEGVRHLAQQLNSKADEITSLASQLTSQLSATQWVGNDATRFRDDWSSHHNTALNQVADALRHASTAATQNASQQDQASNS